MLFKPLETNGYIVLRIGKQLLPKISPYFSFFEKICTSTQELKETFKEEGYMAHRRPKGRVVLRYVSEKVNTC